MHTYIKDYDTNLTMLFVRKMCVIDMDNMNKRGQTGRQMDR